MNKWMIGFGALAIFVPLALTIVLIIGERGFETTHYLEEDNSAHSMFNKTASVYVAGETVTLREGESYTIQGSAGYEATVTLTELSLDKAVTKLVITLTDKLALISLPITVVLGMILVYFADPRKRNTDKDDEQETLQSS